MQIAITESMRAMLEKCVRYAISRNAWISSTGEDDEVTMEEALEFLKEIKEWAFEKKSSY